MTNTNRRPIHFKPIVTEHGGDNAMMMHPTRYTHTHPKAVTMSQVPLPVPCPNA
jgi:hypothetical protein